VRDSGTSFSVCGTALWTSHRTKSLYKGSDSGYGPFEIQGHTCCHLPRRHLVRAPSAREKFGQCHSGGIHQSPWRDSKRSGMDEVSLILKWAEGHVPALSAVYIPGVENWEADFLSRTTVNPGEWSFHPQIFNQIGVRWGFPNVDLMASRLNSKVHGTVEGPPGLCGGRSCGSMGVSFLSCISFRPFRCSTRYSGVSERREFRPFW
ncbi:hypothetical protein PRIEUP_LOCUS550, partial [Pristimantis euphronides]